MKRTIEKTAIDILILILVLVAVYTVAFVTESEPHEVAIWGLVGWLVASRKEQ